MDKKEVPIPSPQEKELKLHEKIGNKITQHPSFERTQRIFKRKKFDFETMKELFLIFKTPILIGIVGVFLLLIIIPIVTFAFTLQDLGSKERILSRNNTGLTLLDNQGKKFFSFGESKEISFVPLSEIPKTMQQAVIAGEDREFYEHPGFSVRGYMRAILANITSGDIVQGGSTITQGLAKNTLLNSDRNFLRKYQELVLALELNRRYSKEDILELFLNSIYYGEGAYGIENASEIYFGKSAKELNLAESAMLAGILPAPSAYSPLTGNFNTAKQKQAQILDTMVELGYITQQEADEAKEEELVFNPEPPEPSNIIAPHFALMVRDALFEEYGESTVIGSGFRVKTTLNRQWQEYAQTTVKNQVTNLQANDVSNGAAVAINPNTGAVEVLVGSWDWNNEDNGKINMAIRPRQPGSSIKPLVYADAFEEKEITPATIIEDKEISFPGGYEPQNYDNRFRGNVTVRQALANSLNIPAVLVLEMVGVDNFIDFAKNLGITTLSDDTDYGLALSLGAGEIPLIELTNAYAVFADQGTYHDPILWTEITDKYSKVIETVSPSSKSVLDPGVAYLISSILSDNPARADVFGGLLTISRPAAVKTGTTNDYKDSLTVGYTPNVAVGVWVGNNDNTPMDRIAGSTGAAPIWRLLMERFVQGTPVVQFRKPSSVIEELVCPFKNLPNSPQATTSAYKEFFLRGTQPDSCAEPTPTITQTPTPAPSETPTPTQAPTQIPSNTPVPTTTPQAPTATPTEAVLPTITLTP